MIVYKIVSIHDNKLYSLYRENFPSVALEYKLDKITKSVHGPIYAYHGIWYWTEAYSLAKNVALLICETHDDAIVTDVLDRLELTKVEEEVDSYWNGRSIPYNPDEGEYAYCQWIKPFAIIYDIREFLDVNHTKRNLHLI